MRISAEASLDPYIGINYNITASLLFGSCKGNCQIGAYLSGNTRVENSLTTGTFAGLYVYGTGVSINGSCTRDFIVDTTTSLHLSLLGSLKIPLVATIYKSIIGIESRGLQYEHFGGSLSFGDLHNESGFILHYKKTFSSDYKFHLNCKFGSDISLIAEVFDLFGKNQMVIGGVRFS